MWWDGSVLKAYGCIGDSNVSLSCTFHFLFLASLIYLAIFIILAIVMHVKVSNIAPEKLKTTAFYIIVDLNYTLLTIVYDSVAVLMHFIIAKSFFSGSNCYLSQLLSGK